MPTAAGTRRSCSNGDMSKRADEPRFDVTSLGESMVRLSVPAGHALHQARSFDAHLGGAESNVCIALASLGRRTAWFGAVPDSPLGTWVETHLRAARVDTAGVVKVEGARLGTYYVELGATPWPTEVTYDRAGSAASTMTPGDVDLDALLDTSWLHLTGITPALGPAAATTIDAALEAAAERGVQVVLDVNHRAKLWTASDARAWLEPRLERVDLLVCGHADAATVLGVTGDDRAVARTLAERTRGGAAVVTHGAAGATAWDGEDWVHADAVPATVIDRLGAGDAFDAGLLDGLLSGSLEEGLRRGAALAALCLGRHGDAVQVDRATLEATMAGPATRPRR